MNCLIKIINEISEKAKGNLKPDLKKYGKNFRSISESAILETLNPLFREYNIAYEVAVQDQQLRVEKIRAGKDSAGNLIEKLVFIADAKVILRLYQNDLFVKCDINDPLHMMSTTDTLGKGLDYIVFEGWGSGVDAGDKATGKAITAATKYALLKGFRLQYSDDPDVEASEDIESIIEEGNSSAKKEELRTNNQKNKETSKEKKEEDRLATEAQLNYVKGLVVACGLTDDEFKQKYGFFPYDTNIPMRKAREIIEELKKLQDDKLPF